MEAQNNSMSYSTDIRKASVAWSEREANDWGNQSQLAQLFATSKQIVSLHVNNIVSDNELNANSVVKDYLTTASDGKEYKALSAQIKKKTQ